MATATTATEQEIRDLRDDLRTLRDEKYDLERDLNDAQNEVQRLEERIALGNSRVRSQLDSLCVALESGRPSVPQTPDQWRRCLTEIAKGGEWENGTWR